MLCNIPRERTDKKNGIYHIIPLRSSMLNDKLLNKKTNGNNKDWSLTRTHNTRYFLIIKEIAVVYLLDIVFKE